MAALALGGRLALAAEPARALPAALEVVAWQPASQVNAVAQAPDGFLFVATPLGTLRSSGAEFARVGPEALNEPSRRVLVSQGGDLWIATGGGHLAPSPETGHAVRAHWRRGVARLLRVRHGGRGPIDEPQGLPSPWVWALAETTDGAIWAGTEAGLVRWDGHAFAAPAGPGPWPNGLVTALFAQDDTLWVGTESGVIAFRDGRAVGQAPGGPVWSLDGASGRGVLAVAGGQLVELDDGGRVRWARPTTSLVVAGDARGGAWTHEPGPALVHWEGGAEVGRIDLGAKVIATSLTLRRDREGSLWLGTAGAGLFQARPRRVAVLGPDHGLPGETPFAVLPASDGAVWVSASRGLVRFGPGPSTRVWRSGQALPTWTPRALAEGRRGDVWVAGGPEGLVRVRSAGDALRYVHGKDFGPWNVGSLDDGVRNVVVAPDGALWVGGRGGVVRFPGEDPGTAGLWLDPATGLCDGGVASVTFAGPRAYVASFGPGVTIVGDFTSPRPDGLRCVDSQRGLPGERVLAVLPGRPSLGSSDAAWVAVDGPPGLHLVVDGKVTAGVPRQALPAWPVVGIADDGHGRLWLTTEQGILRVREDELVRAARGGAAPAVASWTLRDGLSSAHCLATFQPSLGVDGDGRLWAPTLAGVVVVTPPEALPAPVARPVLDGVDIDDRRLAVDGPVTVPAGGHSVALHAAAPSFLRPFPPELHYRLAGDQAPAPMSGGVLRFARLAPGRYHVEITADGNAEPLVVAMLVEAPVWLRPWFLALAVGVVAATAFAGHRLRLRRLERAAEERLRAVVSERARLARDLHDELAQGFASLGFLVEAAETRVSEPSGDVRELFARMRVVLDHTRAGARRAIWDLRATTAAGLSLREALETALDAPAIDAEVTWSIRGTAPARAPALERELPLVVREAVTNAVTHGRARKVAIELLWADDGLSVIVADDGVGPRDALAFGQEAPAGLGLLGMRERLARIGGRVRLARGTDGGSRLEVSVPATAWQKGAA